MSSLRSVPHQVRKFVAAEFAARIVWLHASPAAALLHNRRNLLTPPTTLAIVLDLQQLGTPQAADKPVRQRLAIEQIGAGNRLEVDSTGRTWSIRQSGWGTRNEVWIDGRRVR